MMNPPRKRRKRAAKAKIRELPDGRVMLDLTWSDHHGIRRRARPKFDSERAATKAETLAMRRLENGLPPFPDDDAEPWTVGDVLAHYHKASVPDARPASQIRMKRHREDLERFLGDLGAEALTLGDLLEFRQRRREHSKKKRLSDVTTKKDLSHLRAALRQAKVDGKIEAHIFERLAPQARSNIFPPETESKGQPITQEEFESILVNIGPQYHAALRLARIAGMRKAEFCALRWENVKRDRISLTVSKTGPRDVPLTDEMRALLPPRRIDGGLVFTGPNGEGLYDSLGAAWDRARRRAGLPWARIHDLRHTAATELDELGDRVGMKAALGMKSEATAARYAEHRKFERARSLFERAAEDRRRAAGGELSRSPQGSEQ
jgi:integrase